MLSFEERLSYVGSLDLPDTGPRFERVPKDVSEKTLVAVGGQLTEFKDAIAPAFRSAISNAMLLAQLAADKAAKPGDQVFDWYGKYSEVLRSIGWRIAADEAATKVTTSEALTVHKAIIPVITAALGPAVAASSLIIAALNGLHDMDAQQPWITVFDRNSRHVHGAKFQMSYVEADESGDAKVTLLCFALAASRTITQVLFFKFSEEEVEVRETSQELFCSPGSLPADAIARRVLPFLADNVAALDI